MTWKAGVIGSKWIMAVAALSWSAAAAATDCVGAVTQASVDASGTIFVRTSTLPMHGICNLVDKGAFSMHPEACKATYATLLSARVSGLSVRLYYNDPAVSTCSQIGNWSLQPGFYHVELL